MVRFIHMKALYPVSMRAMRLFYLVLFYGLVIHMVAKSVIA